jgi:SSS family solute:Na+ symporter
LALGSALALFLYPHSMTGILSASSGKAIRRNAAMLPLYSFMLGLLALFGFFAIAAGVDKLPEFAGGFKQFGNNFAVPALLLHSFPCLVRRRRLCRDRHRRAGAGGDHVDRCGEPLYAQYSP